MNEFSEELVKFIEETVKKSVDKYTAEVIEETVKKVLGVFCKVKIQKKRKKYIKNFFV